MHMSRDGHEKLWQALYAMLALTIGICGWYMNRLVIAVDRANDNIVTVSVQVARLETRIDGMEKSLDKRVAVETDEIQELTAFSIHQSLAEGNSSGVLR